MTADVQPPASEQPEVPANNAGGDEVNAKGDKAAEAAAAPAESPAKKAPAPPKPQVHKADWVKDTVYLYQFGRCPTIPSASPFCLKVEAFLRLAGLQYEVIDWFKIVDLTCY